MRQRAPLSGNPKDGSDKTVAERTVLKAGIRDQKARPFGDFPGGPQVRTLRFHC